MMIHYLITAISHQDNNIMSSATASTPTTATTTTTTNVVLKRSLPFSSSTTATPRRLLKNPFGEIQQVKLILMRFANLLILVMNNL
jgi:hypothetical protein